MDFAFDKTTEAIYQRVGAFAGAELPADDLLYRDQNEVFAMDLWRKCGEFGLQGLPVDQAYGGPGSSSLDTIMAIEAFGRSCADEGLVFSVNAHLLSVVVPLWLYGQDHQRDGLLRALASGQKIAAHAMTEQSAGSDVFAMQTTAKKENGKYIIQGEKRYITNAPVADVILVYAMTDTVKGILGGLTPFLIERSRAGVSVTDNVSKMGLRTCTMGHISFENVVAGEEDILGKEGGGLKIFQESMNWERIGMSAMIVGITERLLETVITYVRQRPNAQQQTIIHSLALTKAKLESIRTLVYRAAWSIEHDRAAVTPLASSVKLLSSELYKQTAMEAVQMMGAAGYTLEAGVERSLRNAVAATIYSGTSEIQKNIIAQWLNISN